MADPPRPRSPSLSLPLLALLLAVALPGCLLDPTPPPGQEGASSSNTATPVVPALQEADVGAIYAYTDPVAEAAGKAEFPDTNPFAYRNPWR